MLGTYTTVDWDECGGSGGSMFQDDSGSVGVRCFLIH